MLLTRLTLRRNRFLSTPPHGCMYVVCSQLVHALRLSRSLHNRATQHTHKHNQRETHTYTFSGFEKSMFCFAGRDLQSHFTRSRASRVSPFHAAVVERPFCLRIAHRNGQRLPSAMGWNGKWDENYVSACLQHAAARLRTV